MVHVKTFEMRKTLAFTKTLSPIILHTSILLFLLDLKRAKKLAKMDLQVLEIFYDCL
jgi:hypothetical protein